MIICLFFYLISFEWIAGDSISKDNKQRNKVIFGISSCIPGLFLFSVLSYFTILKGLPPWLIPTLSATARPFLHTFNWLQEEVRGRGEQCDAFVALFFSVVTQVRQLEWIH